VAIITISRGSKSGGQALAECLARHLDYPIVGREIIQDAALKLGVSEEEVGQGMHHAPKLWGRHSLARQLYVAAVQAALSERIVDGNLVYHGLAGQMLLRGLPAVLRMRLIAPLEVRITALMETDGMDRSAAEKYIRDVDDARARWVKMMYDQDINNPALYDLVISTEVMPLPTACLLIATTVAQPAFAATREARARLADFALTCHARLALLSDAQTRALKLEVKAHDGVLEVSGSLPLLPSGQMESDITRVINAVPGVRAIRLEIQWFSP
jgi:cytidylate kinase